MDGSRFDSLLRTLATSPSRRSAIRLVAAPILGGFVARDVLSTEGKKKKKVTLCHSGQTLTVSKKKKKTHLKHGDTLGACAASPSTTTTAPSPSGPSSSACAGLPDGALCNGETGRCLDGICNTPPTCLGRSEGCESAGVCCSQSCVSTDFGFAVCSAGTVGRPCATDNDCHSFACVGYRCVQGTTPVPGQCSHDDSCASGQCGCTGTGASLRCTCREATCGGLLAPCNPADPRGRDVDCCEGSCTGTSTTTDDDFCT